MKILMYAPIFPPQIGGPATQCFHLCRALLERGEIPVVVTPGECFTRSEPDGYRVYRYRFAFTGTGIDKAIRWIYFPFYFSAILVIERPQIVHSHSVSALSFIVGALAKIAGIPSIIKFAGDWVWETLSTHGMKSEHLEEIYRLSFFSRLLKRIERWGVSLFSIIWVPSNFRRDNVRALLGNTDSVRIIPNALILSGGGYHAADAVPIIISANRFIPQKNLPLMIRAFAKMEDERARLVIIGGGQAAEEDKIREEVRRQNVEQRVELAGMLPSAAVYERFAEASFYVSASLEEGFPNVFIEAMHYGLPIVSTDVGGCKEMVKDGINGFLVTSGDEAALSARMNDLVCNADMRDRMAREAFRESTKYDLRTVVEQFMRLYIDLSAKR